MPKCRGYNIPNTQLCSMQPLGTPPSSTPQCCRVTPRGQKIEPRVVYLVKPLERVVGWRTGRGGRDMYVSLSGGCVGGPGLLLDYRGGRASHCESFTRVRVRVDRSTYARSSPQAARSFRNAGWSWVTHVNSVEAYQRRPRPENSGNDLDSIESTVTK